MRMMNRFMVGLEYAMHVVMYFNREMMLEFIWLLVVGQAGMMNGDQQVKLFIMMQFTRRFITMPFIRRFIMMQRQQLYTMMQQGIMRQW